MRILILLLAFTLTGCKLAVIVSSGGDVTSGSDARNCGGGSFCEFGITDPNFSETFTAVARPGFEFQKWQGGPNFFCGDSTNPVCTLTLPGDDFGNVVVAQFAMGRIMPIFEDVGFDPDGDGVRNELDPDDDNDGILDEYDLCIFNPDPDCGGDTTIVQGREWLQPELFSGVTWDDVHSICPLGVCAGVLSNYDLTGWTWASNQDVVDLFEFYAPVDFGGPCDLASNFFRNGWRKTDSEVSHPTFTLFPELMGWTFAQNQSAGAISEVYCGYDMSLGQYPAYRVGAWFYRTP